MTKWGIVTETQQGTGKLSNFASKLFGKRGYYEWIVPASMMLIHGSLAKWRS